jgi:hypothetical protein
MNLPLPYDPLFAAWQTVRVGQVVEITSMSWTHTVASEPFVVVQGRYFDADDMWDQVIDPMLGRSLYYDRQGEPISMRRWGELREVGLDPDGHYGPNSYVRIGEDEVGEAKISTVWLGMDHGWGRGEPDYKPVIFESMIFGGEHDEDQMRYCTEEEAIRGHAEAVQDLRMGMTPWWSHGGMDDDEWHSPGE